MKYLSTLILIALTNIGFSQILNINHYVYKDSIGKRGIQIKNITTENGTWYRFLIHNKIGFTFMKIDTNRYLVKESKYRYKNGIGFIVLYSAHQYIVMGNVLIKHGKYQSFDKDSILSSKGKYYYGKMDGEFREYNNNNKLVVITNYKEGRKNGQFISFFENGRKKERGTYKSSLKIKKWEKWYENGNLFSCGKYNGEYYIDSTIRYSENYEENYVWGHKGPKIVFKKKGKWIYFSKNGKKIKTEYYHQDGKIIKAILFGNVAEESRVKD